MFAWSSDWTTLLLYVKHFLPSIFNSEDFRSSMFCIERDIELTDKIVIEKLGAFPGMIKESHFVLEKSKPKALAFWCTRKLHRIVWNSGFLDYKDFGNNLPKDVKAGYRDRKVHDSWQFNQ